MLATTGRAASVLRGKTGFATKTVHSELYNFSKVDGIEENMMQGPANETGGQMSLQFKTRIPDEDKKLYIVDEASMLSGDLSADIHFATFGSGILLNDFFEVVGKNKVIFVGDPSQLPPVGQSVSPALDLDWLNKQNQVALSYTLDKIERTDKGNDILKLAAAVRQMGLYKNEERFPRLPASNLKNVKLHSNDEAMLAAYLTSYKKTGTRSTLAIARSNVMVQHINREMRRELFGQYDVPLQVGDVLLVTQNNYAVPLTNGDFVSLTELGDGKTRDGLHFRSVKVKSLVTETEYSLLLSMDTLYSTNGNLTNDQNKAMMIDFSYRMRDDEIGANTPKYNKALREDEYLNCLKASFGYAVTCHKAQGGEWDNVYLFLDKKMYGMPRQELFKWWYTAITRAKKELNLVKDWWIS
jgi:ATP-dependent exoDNAse (exonuclease V) alpha subunit